MGAKKSSAQRQALYRKYRPKSLKEVVGQEHITTTLENAIAQNKLSHAYLLTGPRGVGKTSIARILAYQINQLDYNDGSQPLDIIEIDAASNRRIDDIRDLRDKVHIAPVSAKYKVYIIDEVHMLTSESFNALLKTLEEPPAHVIFILATTEVHKLPATIISRTQRHTFKAIPADVLKQHLATIAKQEKIAITEPALELIAQHGDGSFRDSISLLDQVASSDSEVTSEQIELLFGIAPRSALQALLEAAQAGDHQQVLKLVEHHLVAGLTPSGLAEQLLLQLRLAIGDNTSADAQTIELMKQLLQVGTAAFAQLKLETALLALSPATSQPHKPIATEPVMTRTAKESPKQVASLAEDKIKATKPEKVATEPLPKDLNKPSKPAITASADSWPQILQAVKAKNSPLYTVLRMAAPEFSDDELKLTFRFPFHQKRVEDAKHKAIVAATVLETTGESLTIVTAVDSSVVIEPVETIVSSPAADPAHASLIANVQDIMGGGEVIDA